jgi:uncharacterized protein YcnI
MNLIKLIPIPLLALALSLGAVAPAQGHVQVNPTTAAPGDPVRFEFLVPNERSASTVRVSLKIPKDVLPFSFNDPPGWRRSLKKASDGSIDVVRWRGRLSSDGFTEFAFLASTPEREGSLVWKAIQDYTDGREVAWIGPPDSEEPAPVTRVIAGAPRQNAGGEGTAGATGGSDAGGTAAAAPTSGTADDDNRDWLAVALGASGLVLGAAALLLVLAGRRRKPPADIPKRV